MIKEIGVKNQSIETSGITKDYKEAICEYIWNGFEAGAKTVIVSFTSNDLDGVESITIHDDGHGIGYDNIENTFGTFMASEKNSQSIQSKSKANKGKGRFSCFSFAQTAIWNTVTKYDCSNINFSISIDASDKTHYDVSNYKATSENTGTTLTISGISLITQPDLEFVNLEDTLQKAFAWYLYLNRNKGLTLNVCGVPLDPTKYIDYDASITEPFTVDENNFEVSLIVWQERIKEKFCAYYLDKNGVMHGKDTTTFNRNTVNFNHSVYITSDFFTGKEYVSLHDNCKNLDGQVAIEEQTRSTLLKLKEHVQEMIQLQMNKYMAIQAEQAIADMSARKSFPVFRDDPYEQMRKRDLLNVTKQIYQVAPNIFYRLKEVQEKSLLGLLNLLLSTDERESVLTIVENVVELTAEQRKDFAAILKKTRLQNIVETIKFVEERYKVIEGLKKILYEIPDYANERDHVQKIIEQHYWLFGEQYNLVSADVRMQKALEKYVGILYGANPESAELSPDQESERRMDIFLCTQRNTEDATGSAVEENLIVELKAPKKKLTKKVHRQIEDYMEYVYNQPNFNSQFRRWKFIAVCSEVDEYVRNCYTANEDKGKKGLTRKVNNYELYALTWDDIFKSFDLRHSFLLSKLKIDREKIAKELEQETGLSLSRETANAITDAICNK